MGMLSGLFSSKKVVDTAAEVVKSGTTMLDEAFYTDQGKAEFRAKAADNWLELQKIVANQSTPTAVSRRVVAILVIVPAMIMALGCFGMVLIMDDPKAKVDAIVAVADAFKLGWATTAVVAFYFGKHIIGAMGK